MLYRNHEPKQRGAAVVFSAFFMCSCAATQTYPSLQSSPIHETNDEVTGRWERGVCIVRNNSLSYSDAISGMQKTVQLDLPLSDVHTLLCNENFTVIIENGSAVASLGGDAVLRGVEMLGNISGHFTPANSYSLNIREPSAETIVSATLTNRDFVLLTAAGNRWTIDLSDPREWRIY